MSKSTSTKSQTLKKFGSRSNNGSKQNNEGRAVMATNKNKTANELSDFFLNLSSAQEKNSKEADHLANYEFGFQVPKKVAKLLRNSKNQNSIDSEADERSSMKRKHYIPDGPLARDRKKKRKKSTATGISAPVSHNSETSVSNEGTINFEEIEENDGGTAVKYVRIIPVNTIDEHGNEKFNVPWAAKPCSSTNMLFSSKMFQLVGNTEDKSRCLVKCKSCPLEAKPFLVTYGNNSNLIRHAKTVK